MVLTSSNSYSSRPWCHQLCMPISWRISLALLLFFSLLLSCTFPCFLSPSFSSCLFVCLLLSHAIHMSTRDSPTQAYCTLSYALFCPFSWFRRFTDGAVVILGVGERVAVLASVEESDCEPHSGVGLRLLLWSSCCGFHFYTRVFVAFSRVSIHYVFNYYWHRLQDCTAVVVCTVWLHIHFSLVCLLVL